jgi:acetate---CoA ligase (ADP-forming)
MNDMSYILSPGSIAVVGASNRAGSLGLAIFRNLLDAAYQGILYPVNPKATSIQGVKAYPALTEISDPIDMAVLIVPSEGWKGSLRKRRQKTSRAASSSPQGLKKSAATVWNWKRE